MNKYGLIGKKLSHSLSPTIHNYIFEKMGIDAKYSLYEVENKEMILKEIEKNNIKGFNITIPYKESILDKLDFISKEAKEIGAINLVKIIDKKIYGYNSDYFGILKMFEKSKVIVKDKICYILGSGGAAKSVIVALKDLGAKKIIVVTRDLEKNKKTLMEKFNWVEVISYDEIETGDIIINTTPVGMYPNVNESPVDEEIVKKFNIAVDLIYNPKCTKFLELAKKHKLLCVSGLSMLIYQGIKSDELWENIKIDEKEVEELEKLLMLTLSEENL